MNLITVNLELEHWRRTHYASGHEPIIPVACSRGLPSPISLKTASGVVNFNNETISAQKMEYVDMYHVQPDTSNTYELVTTYHEAMLQSPLPGVQ